jgi:hypothetical protein
MVDSQHQVVDSGVDFKKDYMMVMIDAPPSSLCDPKKVQKVGFAELARNLVPLPTSSTKKGRGVVLEASGLD